MKKLGIITLIFVTFLITGCGCQKKESKPNNPPVEQNGVILPDKTNEGLKYSNASIVYENGISTLVLTVTNTEKTDKKIEMISIKIYNEKETLLKETSGYIGKTLKQNESKTITTQLTIDLRKAKTAEYSIKK